jgi:TolA-binding protein
MPLVEQTTPPSQPVAPPPMSRLVEQNDLFSAAMEAERHGHHAAALHKLDDLIKRFPEGPLTESARGERQRIRSASGE